MSVRAGRGAESEDAKGDGGLGAELPAISASECEDDDDESKEASERLSTGESLAGV